MRGSSPVVAILTDFLVPITTTIINRIVWQVGGGLNVGMLAISTYPRKVKKNNDLFQNVHGFRTIGNPLARSSQRLLSPVRLK